jgi:TusA-related sulfurtransferase
MTEPRTVDCRGLACPQPVINTKNALQGSTTPIMVIVDNEASCTNVRRFAESQGARVEVEQQAGEFHLTIEPGHEVPPIVCSMTAARNMIVYVSPPPIGARRFGRGDSPPLGLD